MIKRMEKLEIYKYQLQRIEEALRQTINILDCDKGDTCYKRNVMQAMGWVKNALNGDIDKHVERM